MVRGRGSQGNPIYWLILQRLQIKLMYKSHLATMLQNSLCACVCKRYAFDQCLSKLCKMKVQMHVLCCENEKQNVHEVNNKLNPTTIVGMRTQSARVRYIVFWSGSAAGMHV